MAVKAVREGFHTVTPYLITREVDQLIDFVKRAFGAEETFRTTGSSGGTHAEVRIGDSMVMIGGGIKQEPMPVMFHLYLADVDGAYNQAVQAGGSSILEPTDYPDGERRAGVKDPFGNQWYIGCPKS